MGPQRKLGIYIGYESPSILNYLETITGDPFTARYADYIFDEDHFPALGGNKNKKIKRMSRNFMEYKRYSIFRSTH